MSDDTLALFGTSEPRPDRVLHTAGRTTFEWVGGGIHAIRRDGVEVVRAVTFPVRDRDWGTLAPVLSAVRREDRPEGRALHWSATYRSGEAALHVEMALEATADTLAVRGRGRADGRFETNRAGFTVLHPVAASGCPVSVEHSDGTREESRFPVLIDPWQPFRDIHALEHVQEGIRTDCRFAGDTFEMEDQRQWSDASFKTYNRPLIEPWPYTLADGEVIEQAVTLRFSGTGTRSTSRGASVRVGLPTGTLVPDLALVLTPAEARDAVDAPGPLRAIAPRRLTAHVDPETGDVDLSPFAILSSRSGAAIDLDYAARCDGDLDEELGELAEHVREAALTLSSLLVCPSVDRDSTPPGSAWPPCPALADLHAAARRAFPDTPIGGGMLSYFPEFNRKRPPLDGLDFVAYGTNPIVHAADDRSVMQTLTAVPWILRSGKAIAGGTPCRLGLSSIPMRQNPYGSRTIDNPGGGRLCMAATDPRHHARFGAAFTLGYLAAVAPFGPLAWTPAAGAGARGVDADGELSPLGRLLVELAPLAGLPVRAVRIGDPERCAALAAGKTLWLANLTDEALDVDLGGGRTDTLAPYETRRAGAAQA